jgi:hypothetical protein
LDCALALLLLFNLATNFVVYRVLVTSSNFEQIARERIEWDAKTAGASLPPGDIDRQTDALRAAREHWYLLPFLAIPVSVLGLTAVFYVVLFLVRAGAPVLKVFSVVCWSMLIYRGIGGIVTIAALLVRGPDRFFPGAPESWSPTSLAHLISRAAVSPNIYSAISKVGIVLVWWLAALAIGFSKVSKNLGLLKSVTVVAAAEAVYLALNAAGWFAGTL